MGHVSKARNTNFWSSSRGDMAFLYIPHEGYISILTPEAPNQPSPVLLGRFPLLLSLLHLLLFPSPQILIFHCPYGGWGCRNGCPQATTTPGLGLALVSSRHSTHLALHPLPNISPKINQKIIIPSWRSIKGRSCPHSSLVANQDSQEPRFPFTLPTPPPPPFFFSFPGKSLLHRSLCPRKICHHCCMLQSTYTTSLPPPSP